MECFCACDLTSLSGLRCRRQGTRRDIAPIWALLLHRSNFRWKAKPSPYFQLAPGVVCAPTGIAQQGGDTMRVAALRAAAFSLIFGLLASASVHARAAHAASPEAHSPLSAITAWLNHLARPPGSPHRRTASSPPLPRPRPAELAPPAAVAPNKTALVPIYD